MSDTVIALPIVIEAETPGEPHSALRILCGGHVRGEAMSAAQAHVMIGELLEALFPMRREPL